MPRTRFNNYAGMTIGSLYVDSLSKSVHKEIMWKVICSNCGNSKLSRGSTLRKSIILLANGKIKHVSCGCHKRTINNKHHRNWKGAGDLGHTWYSHLKNQAMHRKLEFTISIEYLWELFLKQEKQCALTGEKLSINTCKNYHNIGNASLDRIDSNKGYIEGNVQWVLKDINLMKQRLSQQVFVEFCKKVSKYQESKENKNV